MYVREVAVMELGGAVVVVTGASSGLGRRFCLDLAGRGAVVTGLARRADRLAALEEEMRRSSPDSAGVVCDVSDTTAYASTLTGIERDRGRIDVLVNNAGIGAPDGAPAVGTEAVGAYREVMETNYFAAVTGTLTVLPGMLARGRGVVVNVSSDTGRAPSPGEAAYSASKAALSAFTEALAFDTEGRGVHLHVLYPGWVPTEMTTGQGGATTGPQPPRMVRRTQEQISRLVIERMGGPRIDIDATAVARLAPMARSLFPSLYRRGVRRSTG
ncbi:MAG TPA: SDR family oxidoreductase [Acidimicrobiales bacterium]|nr:SDR family oxidoreductase [Acidimicrobiales bacterium]